MAEKLHDHSPSLEQRITSALSLVEDFSLAELKALARRRDQVRRTLAGLLNDELGGIATEKVALELELVESNAAPERLVGDPLPSGVTPADVAKAVAMHTLDEPALDAAGLHKNPDMLNGETFAVELGVSRQTVNEWRQQGRVIGLKSNKQGYRYPLTQLDARKRPLSMIASLVDIFGGHWAAWSWLTAPHAGFGGNTPLDMLKTGETDRVMAAAEGAGGDFA